MRANVFIGFAVSVAVLLAGCATTETRTDPDLVRARAQSRWDALVKNDFKAAYELLSPGSRGVLTSDQYVSTLQNGFWKAARVDKVICEGPERCEVHSTVEFVHQGVPFKTPNRDIWIKESGNWWYLRQ